MPGQSKLNKIMEENLIAQLLFDVIGESPRPGLAETPARVIKALREKTSGYNVDIPSLFKVFEDGAEKCDEMVIVRNIPFNSMCEHHMEAIFGTATIGYIPNGKVVGLSKLARVTEAFAKRLQVQERLTNQIADAVNDNLNPKGVGVVITARHMCMECRGIESRGSDTVTSALRGVIKDQPDTRAEFMSLAKS